MPSLHRNIKRELLSTNDVTILGEEVSVFRYRAVPPLHPPVFRKLDE